VKSSYLSFQVPLNMEDAVHIKPATCETDGLHNASTQNFVVELTVN